MSHPVDIDKALIELDRELRELACLEVNRAAKERGWARLSRELDRRPVRQAAPVRGSHRWALGSLAAAVVVIALVLGIYGGTVWLGADNNQGTGPVASVVTSEGASSPNTSPTEGTTATSGGDTSTPVTSSTPHTAGSGSGASSTAGSSVTPSTGVTPGGGVTPSSGGTPNGGGTPSTEGSSQGTTTTKPMPTTTTTNEQQYASAQRDKTAKAVALDLGALVCDYFVTGDMSGARALVASDAQSSLVQMIYSLKDPYGFRWVSTKPLTADTVRVTLEFNDRVSNGQGELVEVAKRYALTIQVSDDRAIVNAITWAP